MGARGPHAAPAQARLHWRRCALEREPPPAPTSSRISTSSSPSFSARLRRTLTACPTCSAAAARAEAQGGQGERRSGGRGRGGRCVAFHEAARGGVPRDSYLTHLVDRPHLKHRVQRGPADELRCAACHGRQRHLGRGGGGGGGGRAARWRRPAAAAASRLEPLQSWGFRIAPQHDQPGWARLEPEAAGRIAIPELASQHPRPPQHNAPGPAPPCPRAPTPPRGA